MFTKLLSIMFGLSSSCKFVPLRYMRCCVYVRRGRKDSICCLCPTYGGSIIVFEPRCSRSNKKTKKNYQIIMLAQKFHFFFDYFYDLIVPRPATDFLQSMIRRFLNRITSVFLCSIFFYSDSRSIHSCCAEWKRRKENSKNCYDICWNGTKTLEKNTSRFAF